MYNQRAFIARDSLDPVRPWEPVVEDIQGRERHVEIEENDWYAAIDDIAEGQVVWEIARWPQVDEQGRLVFDRDERELRTVDMERAQEGCDRARNRLGQFSRPLRVGDVFQVHSAEAQQADEWEIGADVTKPAREAARIALYAAVAPRLEPEEARQLPDANISEQQEEG